jgi:hypothetical protein
VSSARIFPRTRRQFAAGTYSARHRASSARSSAAFASAHAFFVGYRTRLVVMGQSMPASGRTGRDGAAYDGAMRVPPTRPLPTSCYWILGADSAHLYWNEGCIGYVAPQRGRLTSVIQWRQRVLAAPCGSVAQGMRWIERWVEKRKGFPGGGKPRWYDNLERERARFDLSKTAPSLTADRGSQRLPSAE